MTGHVTSHNARHDEAPDASRGTGHDVAPELHVDAPAVSVPPLAAVVLSGGRGSRLGGVSKATLDVGGGPLLDGVLDALAGAGIRESDTIVVGEQPVRSRPGVRVTREEPQFGGPLAALSTGLDLVSRDAEEVLVLACDLPGAAELVPLLVGLDGRHGGAFGTCVLDGVQRHQWLAARYRRAPLAAVVEQARVERGTLDGAPLRAALDRLPLATVMDETGVSRDVDTPADVAREKERTTAMSETPKPPAHHLPPADLVPWTDAVTELYGLPESFSEVDIAVVLDVARDVSKSVTRPAAPVTTFLLGVALGRGLAADGGTQSGELGRLARQVQEAALAVPFQDPDGADGGNGGNAADGAS